MLRLLFIALGLRRLRAENPSLFDGKLAWAEIEGSFADEDGAS